MCGISGFYGRNALTAVLAITLGQLERGTRGTGIAYTCNRKIKIVKDPVHPLAFVDMHLDELDNNANIAIGHNRLPTAGGVAYENTHPFLSCYRDFTLVHNGHMFIDNLRSRLIEMGHRIEGETDSEVLCHLIEELYWEHRSFKKALEDLEHYGFSGAIMILTKKGEIYAFRDFWHPLYIKVCDNEVALASTKKAIGNVFGDKGKWIGIRPYQVVRVYDGKVEKLNKGKKRRRRRMDKLFRYLLKEEYYYFV